MFRYVTAVSLNTLLNMTFPNYYSILHVQPDAPLEVIKSSYRALMMKLKQHPDLGGEHGMAVRINEAYAVLRDQKKRAKYDSEYLERLADDIGPGLGSEPSSRKARPEYKQSARVGDCLFCGSALVQSTLIQEDSQCPTCNSPLYPVAQIQLNHADKRAISRVGKGGSVRVYTQPDTYHNAQVRDLSPAGMRLSLQHPLGHHHIIRLDGEQLQAIATVVNHRETAVGHYEVGAEFLTLKLQQTQGTFVSFAV